MSRQRTLLELHQLVGLAILAERLASAQGALASYGWAEPAIALVRECMRLADDCRFPTPDTRRDFEHYFSTIRIFVTEGGPPASMDPAEIVDILQRVQASVLKAGSPVAPDRISDQRRALLLLLERRGRAARPLPRAEAAVYLHSDNEATWRQMIDGSGFFDRDNRDSHKLRLTAEGREAAEELLDVGEEQATGPDQDRSPSPKERWPLPDYEPEEQQWFPTEPDLREVTSRDAEKLRNLVDLVVAVATGVERRAVLSAMRPCKRRRKISKAHISNETYYVGRIGEVHVAVVMSQMGTSSKAGASAFAVSEALKFWKPRGVLAVGIAFGRDPQKQALGDVLVSEQVSPYELQRVGEGATIHRGGMTPAGQVMLNRFLNVTGWQFACPGGRHVVVRPGELLSGEKLVDRYDFHTQLFEDFPNAIGGEMEATGVANAAHRERVEWVIVKAICDWGYGKQKAHQALAAAAAVSLVAHVLGAPDALNGLPESVTTTDRGKKERRKAKRTKRRERGPVADERTNAPPVPSQAIEENAPRTSPFALVDPPSADMIVPGVVPGATQLLAQSLPVGAPCRDVVVVPYSLPKQVVVHGEILEVARQARAVTKRGSPMFPLIEIQDGLQRHRQGILSMADGSEVYRIRFGLGFDGSFGQREFVREAIQPPPGAAGPGVGLFTCLDRVLGALVVAQRLAPRLPEGCRCWMILNLDGVEGHPLTFDYEGSAVRGIHVFRRNHVSASSSIRVGGNFDPSLGDDDLVDFALGIGQALGYYFGCDSVKSLATTEVKDTFARIQR